MTTSITVNQTTIDLVDGDITLQSTDAIVNAANSGLRGGGGVDGAIYRAAGWDDLQAACRKIGHCNTGDAVITPGFKLKATYIIHTVGPIYSPGEESPRLLKSAYQRSLEVAVENQAKSIAFPSISTGVYGYPHHEAAEIALQTAIEFARTNDSLELIRFVLFGQKAFDTFQKTLFQLNEQGTG